MNIKPSEKALLYKAKKDELGSNKAVAEHFSVSEATVSRYINILKLPDDEIKNIDSGERSIRKTNSIKKKNKKTNLTPQFSDRLIAVIDYLARTVYATLNQISKEIKLSVSTTRDATETLISHRIIQKNTEYLPHAFSLTQRGCVLANVNKPKHFYSASAIHQRLMRNEIEHEIKIKNTTAKFINRTECWNKGLFPSIGEHLLEFISNKQKERALVLIDDYGMAPNRTLKSLNRIHDNKKTVTRGDLTLKWVDIITRLMIYTTSERQKINFEKFYKTNKDEFNPPTVIRHIPAIWIS